MVKPGTSICTTLVLLLLSSSALALGFPALAPSPVLGQPSACGEYFNYRPDPAADLPDQREALIKLWTATQGDLWVTNTKIFFPTDGDVGMATLLTDTLEIVEADAAAETAAGHGCDLMQTVSAFRLTAYVRPWATPNTSYCDWTGIGCCFSGGGLASQFCSAGAHSVAIMTLTGQGLRGRIPDIFAAFTDLQYLALDHNPALVGKLPDFPAGLASKLQSVMLTGTGLSQCEELSYGDVRQCLPNWLKIASVFNPFELYQFLQHAARLTATAVELGTASTAAAESATLLQDIVTVSPSFYGYRGCSCLQNYHPNLTALESGAFQLECLPDDIFLQVGQGLTLPIALPAALVGGPLLILGIVFAIFYKEIFREMEIRRNNRLKSRNKPGTLTDEQYRMLGLPGKELTLCMTDIAGSTALWEAGAKVMEQALALQEKCLRSLLPLHCGHEVYTEGDAFVISFHDPLDGIQFVLALQHALLKLAWPEKLLELPQAASIRDLSRDVLLFAGLRLRAVLHTGWPTTIETHQTTGHISYSGMMVELTEALSNLPSGGQCIMSGQTYQRAFPQLQAIADCTSRKSKAMAFFKGRKWCKGQVNDSEEAPQVQKTHHQAQSSLDPANKASEGTDNPLKRHGRHRGVEASSPSTLPLNRNRLPSTMSISSEPDIENIRMPNEFISASPIRSRSSTIFGSQYNLQISNEFGKLTREMAETEVDESSLLFLDMGAYNLRAFPELSQPAPGSPALQGLQIMQVLPRGLLGRASHFVPFSGAEQLTPSYLEAPGSPSAQITQPQQQDDLPDALDARHNVTIVFCSPCSSQLGPHTHKEEAMYRFQSIIRTTLLLLDGYEAQEMHGVFMLAFRDHRVAVEWAVGAQLCLLRLQRQSKLSDALLAKIGIATGPMIKICPHKASGRADYFGQAVNRAARLKDAASPGQVVMDEYMLLAVMHHWAEMKRPLAACSGHCPLAASNFFMLADQLQGPGARLKSVLSTKGLSPDGPPAVSLRSRSAELPRLSSQKRMDREQPLTQIALHASLLGSYMLKGVPGVHALGQVMPQEIHLDLQATNSLGKLLKMQRGKTTCVDPPDPTSEPWTIEIPFVDIFSLPLLSKSQTHSPLQA
ncbi:hypothetical protein WJX74_000225 [Apatococcus lobatus]|uniref:Guanylate cyclase domain-containing protein n=1 Tax=Apatococcus lobatus TaxID=904363 RepID=A0AAW1RXS0_9CHLO